jgi:hypothetical protein
MRHISSSLLFVLLLAGTCGISKPVLGQEAAPTTPMLQGGVSRTQVSGSDVLVGTVIVTKNPHVHFTVHRDYVSGRVYNPAPTPQECAAAMNTGLSIFNTVMGIVDSCGGYSSGGSSSSCSSPSPSPTYSSGSCSTPRYSGCSSGH